MTLSEKPSEEIHRTIELKEECISNVPDMGQPAKVLNHGIELMPVGHEKAAAVNRGMKGTRLDMDVRVITCEIRDPFVVVARDVDDL